MTTDTWPDGTPKSRGNAFDWRNKGSIFSTDPVEKWRATVAKMQAEGAYKPSPSITIKRKDNT